LEEVRGGMIAGLEAAPTSDLEAASKPFVFKIIVEP